jgi:hypothetical protein
MQRQAFFVAIFAESVTKLEFDVAIHDEVEQNYSMPGKEEVGSGDLQLFSRRRWSFELTAYFHDARLGYDVRYRPW